MHFTNDDAKLLDRLLSKVVEKNDWVYFDEIEQILKEIKPYDLNVLLKKLEALNASHNFEIIEIRDNCSWFKANKNTDQFLKNGGFVQFIIDKVKEQQIEAEQKELQRKKLQLDIRNSEKIHKTYWWTFSFSVIALIISLILLALKLFF